MNVQASATLVLEARRTVFLESETTIQRSKLVVIAVVEYCTSGGVGLGRFCRQLVHRGHLAPAEGNRIRRLSISSPEAR